MTDSTDNKKRSRQSIVHPLAGADLSVYLRRYFANLPYNRPPRLSRALTTFAACVRSPFSFYEWLRWELPNRKRGIPRNPVFIVGHWRSGTTHLHNLISQDPQFAWLSLGQTVMPGNMLGPATRLAYKLLRRKLPKKRSFDNVRIGVDAPQEEEIALGNLCPLSYFNCYYYPQKFEENFRRSVLLENTTESERVSLSNAYARLAGKLSFLNGGKQLLFKNPASTVRLLLLKELFPDAKFIHIVRNPYEVFSSSLKRINPMLNAFAWQKYDHLDQETIVINCYRNLMKQYLEQAPQIPAGDIIETSYEAIVASPHDELARIFEALQLPDYETSKGHISRYLESLGDYQPNKHTLTPLQIERIETEWGFAIDHWNYRR
ncbi:sulfotransferase [uncultured Gimesia sp.]|uniref:sulfotransferase family protein n=1 Tax=uncultured Gimesia sp. TaxID=1678688 RepID=UPI002620E3A8|nr:sulfotransferase [uncultured Gimesia sp.]